MTILSSLPADVFDQILGYSDLSYQAINLWQCGDRTLQRKIELGASTITLQSGNPFTNRQLPQMLMNLRNLKELSLHVHDIILLSPWPIVSVIETLLPSLLTLKINIYWGRLVSSSASSIYNELRQGPPGGSLSYETLVLPLFIAISNARNLKTLELGRELVPTIDDLQLLPPSLTSLSLVGFVCKEPPQGDMPTFPRSLLSLTVAIPNGFSHAFAAALPPSLTHLNTIYDISIEEEVFAALPRTLTSVVGPCVASLGSEPKHAFPPELPTLVVTAIPNLDRMLLPSHLTSFSFLRSALSNAQLLSLPRSLNNLIISTTNDIAKESWPPGLQHLTCSVSRGTTSTFVTGLPPLKSLGILESVDHSLLSLLPTSLQSLVLSIEGQVSPSTTLPPSLKYVNFSHYSGDNSFPLRCIPGSVTALLLSGYSLMDTDWVHLPPKLRSLQFGKLNLSTFNDKDPNLLARAQLLRQIGLESGCDVIVPPASPTSSSSVQVFDLLPRTLTQLIVADITSVYRISAEGWSRLPSLTGLTLGTSCGASNLLHIPAHRLQHLTVRDELEDAHGKWLSRKLKTLSSSPPSTFPQIGDAFIRNAPVAVETFWSSGPMPSALSLRRDRIIAFTSKDRSELNRLLS